MARTTTAALIASGCLAAGLAACGGSEDSGDDSAGASSGAQTSTAAAPAAAGKFTPPGTKLAPGDKATVGWVPSSEVAAQGAGARRAIPLEVTVESIEKGSGDDLKDIRLSGDQAGATPYFVKVTITNLGKAAAADDDPDLALTAFDDRGQRQASVTFIGDFPRCSNKRPPQPFARGKSYETCMTYLVGGGGSIEELRWNQGSSPANDISPYYEDPVVWEGG